MIRATENQNRNNNALKDLTYKENEVLDLKTKITQFENELLASQSK
jgi:hypothetical protein